nr:MAG: RNA-dependent RNA polymerase [Sanya bunya-like virus 20]
MGKCYSSDVVKSLYKLRHNTFAALCLDALGLFSGHLETDIPLSNFGIESKRTPDFIFEKDGKLRILEFTVAQRWDSVLFNKGGGISDLKYTEEIKLLKGKGHDAVLHIIPAILDEMNVRELASSLLEILPINEDLFMGQLRRFFTLSIRSSKSLSSMRSSSELSEGTQIKQFADSYDRLFGDIDKEAEHTAPLTSSVICIPNEMASSIIRSAGKCSESLKKFALHRSSREKIRFTYDVSEPHRGIRWHFGDVGDPLHEAVSLLSSGNINKYFPLIRIMRGSNRVPVSEIQGTFPITIQSSRTLHESSVPFSFDLPFDYEMKEFEAPRDGVIDAREATTKSWVSSTYNDELLNLDYYSLKRKDLAGSKKMMANHPVTDDSIALVVSSLRDAQTRSESIDRLIHHPKPMFTYPYTDVGLKYSYLESLPVTLAKRAAPLAGRYTAAIIQKVVDGDFKKYSLPQEDAEAFELKAQLSRYNSEVYDALGKHGKESLKLYRHSLATGAFAHIPEITDLEAKISEANKKLRSLQVKSSSEKTQTRLVQLKCGKKDPMKANFDAELAHFNRNGSMYKAVNRSEVEPGTVIKNVEMLIGGMLKPNLPEIDFSLFNPPVEGDLPFLSSIKSHFHGMYSKYASQYLRSPLGHSLILTHNLCKTLFKESTRSYNSSFVHVDNLGFENVLVLVRGGKKIFSKQVSRLFRMIYPCSKDAYSAIMGGNPNFVTFTHSEQHYILTPWMQLHQDVLFDGISAPFRFFSYLNSTSLHQGLEDLSELDCNDLLPVALGLSNRRKTESFMHNVRYLLVNPLALNSNIQDIAESFAGLNYTYLDMYLRDNLIDRYAEYYASVVRLKAAPTGNLQTVLSSAPLKCFFTGCELKNQCKLVNTIYSTYLMTKAPVNPTLEQAANLLPILKDIMEFSVVHPDVRKMKDMSLRMDIRDLDASVYDDDFKYDPVYCQNLGIYAARFLRTRVGSSRISDIWNRCVNAPFDKMANPNGLRGWSRHNFFNKKGFEVVYEYLNEKSDTKLSDLINEYMSMPDKQASMAIRQDGRTFQSHYMDLEARGESILDRATFHIVDKIQRGGGREIFVMDIFTKSVQSPVESFFAKLCKHIPNEMISVPSNRRSSVVHSMFFEKKLAPWVKEVVRWVLDCRRWAPHSVLQKYVHFIYGMKGILPRSFLEQFCFLMEKMMDKRFVVRSRIFDSISKNQTYEPYLNLMKQKTDPCEMYEMLAPFSFVMGIFNYLSSMMHAFNQMHATELIRLWHLKRNLGLVVMSMNAHSDDSAGESQHEDPRSIDTTLVMYDYLLKASNHMLSTKKSQVNRNIYFEFLSILYLKNQMLPVSSKFLSSIPFKPTDNGYSADLMFAVSQSLEAYSQGCTMSESYLLMKLSEKMVQSLYGVNRPLKLPPQLLGQVDSLPIEYMLGGPLTDMYKHLVYNRENVRKAVKFMQELHLIDGTDVLATIKWDMRARLPKKETFESILSDADPKYLDSWFLNNCKSASSYLNIAWYSNKLKDRKYLASLLNEPDSRRYSRIFAAGRNHSLVTTAGVRIRSGEVLAALSAALETDECAVELEGLEKTVERLVGELVGFHDGLSKNTFSPSNIISQARTIKPVRLTASFGDFGSLREISTDEYIVARYEPEMFKMFGRTKDITRSVHYLNNIVNMYVEKGFETPETVKQILNKITGRDSKVYNFITYVQSENRNLLDQESYLHALSDSLLPNKKLVTDFKRAVAIDSNNSFRKRGVPESVKKLVNAQSSKDFFSKWGVDNLDIFVGNLDEIISDLKKDVPLDWLPYIFHDYQDGLSLSENFFWSFWEKEQKKWGSEWLGEGKLFFSVPECIMSVTMMNSMVTSISVGTSDLIEFSQMSSWFIGSIFGRELNVMSQMIDPSSVPDTQIVLGYSYQKKVWSLSLNRGFDVIFDIVDSTEVHPDPVLYSPLRWTVDQGGRTCVDVQDYGRIRIKKILDSEFDKYTDISPFLDPAKMAKVKDKRLKKMCYECALYTGSTVKYDQTALLDNIGRTKIYGICFRSPTAPESMRGKPPDDALLTSFLHEKKRAEEFGFPSEGDIASISSNPWTGSMPLAIQKHAYKLGEVALTKEEMDYVYNLLKNSESADPEMLLADLKMLYGETTAVQTVAGHFLKDERIFTMCFSLGRGSRISSIHQDLYSLVVESMATGMTFKVISQKQKEISRTFRKKIAPHEVFLTMHAKSIMDCVSMLAPTCADSITSSQVIDVIQECMSKHTPETLSGFRFKTDLLRATDFFTSPEKRNGWIVDCFDSLRQTRWFTRPPKKGRDWASQLTEFGQLAAETAKIPYTYSDTISLRHRGKVIKVKDTPDVEIKVGMVTTPFYPLNEEQIDEFEFSIGVEDEPEEEVEEDEDEKGRTIKWAYLRRNIGTLNDLRKVRGTAWELLIYSNCYPDVSRAVGLRMFVRNKFSGPKDMLCHSDSFLIYVGPRKGLMEIEGFKEVAWEHRRNRYRGVIKSQPFFWDLAGKSYHKSAYFTNPMLASRVYSEINAVWGRLNIDSDAVEKKRSAVRSLKERVKAGSELDLLMDEYNSVLEHALGKNKTKTNEDLSSIITKVLDKLGGSGIDQIVEKSQKDIPLDRLDRLLREKPNNFRVNKDIQILSDPQVLSELETLSPGISGSLFTHSLRMTPQSKRSLLRTSLNSITSEQNKVMKKKKAQLHLIISTILGSVIETNSRNNENAEFFRDMSNLVMSLDEDSEEGLPSLFEIEPDADNVELELDYDAFVNTSIR